MSHKSAHITQRNLNTSKQLQQHWFKHLPLQTLHLFSSLVLATECQELFHLESTYRMLLILENNVSFNQPTNHDLPVFLLNPSFHSAQQTWLLRTTVGHFFPPQKANTEKSCASPRICFPHFLIPLHPGQLWSNISATVTKEEYLAIERQSSSQCTMWSTCWLASGI